MSRFSRTQVSDSTLGCRLSTNAAHDHDHTAHMLADIAEFDARKLYLPAACPSMLVFCVRELRYSEDEAYVRIRAGRAARKFPAIFEAVADGRLSLTAVVQLAPHLTSETTPDAAEGLLAAAAYKSKSEIQQLLAERFPRPDVSTRLEPIAAACDQLVPEPVDPLAPEPVLSSKPDRVAPLSPKRYPLQLTIDEETQALLQEAQELLSHTLPPRDVAGVIKRALRALVPALRKQKFAATDRPRASCRHTNAPRHVSAHVKRAVWERDGGQCTFVSESGKRCPSRTLLEFDHIDEVARGGRATVAGMRLLCRAHNQYAAECTFGAEFMQHKREEAREAAAAARVQARETEAAAARTAELAASHTQAQAAANAAEETQRAQERDVVPWLRRLGFRADDAGRAAAFCEGIPEASLEVRVRAALVFLCPRASYRRQPATW